jgi:ABC-type oligopeptide transport system substrate-binding subunit
MIKKFIIYSIIFATFLTFFSSCKKENKSDFIHYISSEPLTLDPQTAKDDNSKLIISSTFDGLTKINGVGETVLNLAESYEYHPESNSYEFHLKDGLKWADGRDLTSKDFVFAFKRIFNKNTKAEGTENFFCIKNAKAVFEGEIEENLLGVKAIDDKTIIFELEYGFHAFLDLLSLPLAMPCNREFFDETKGKYGLEYNTVLTNGALIPYAWYHGEAIYFKKNSFSTDAKLAPNSLTLFINDEYNSSDIFIDGNNDVVVTEEIISGKFISDIYNERVYGLLFNKEDDLFSNLNLRKALSLSFNRESMKDSLPTGFSLNNDLFLGVSDNYIYDVELAKEYLDKALEELEIKKISKPKIICKKDEKSKDALMFALQYWQEKLNVYFVVEELDTSEFNERLMQNEYDVALIDYNLPANKISLLQEINYTLKSENINEMVNDYYRSEDFETAKIVRDEAFKLLAGEILFIPVYNNQKYIYYKKDIEGIEYSSEHSYIKFVNASKK